MITALAVLRKVVGKKRCKSACTCNSPKRYHALVSDHISLTLGFQGNLRECRGMDKAEWIW